jgi:hypothetical protein
MGWIPVETANGACPVNDDYDAFEYDDEPGIDYPELAATAIRALIERELAVPWIEVEARLAEQPWGDLRHGINLHNLTKGKARLLRAGAIETLTSHTRGGQDVPLLVPVNQHRRVRAVADAAARKWLLYAR